MRSLYVHIPFCSHICSYCDFCKVFYKEEWADSYLKALQYEIEDKKIEGLFDTIYIGGGTPSCLSYQQLEKLFEILKPYSKQVKEYTIEVNPESVDERKVDLMIKYKINRVSIGVQTFHDQLLKKIERYHTSKEAINVIKMLLNKGIQDINVDLIYGLPNQTLDDVYKDIDIIDKLDVSHVSIYSLILEDHTLLKKENYQGLSDEEDAYWYDCINDYLKKKNFNHYEVSNYYRKKKSMHNLVYWHYEDYIGIGAGAHSLCNHQRIENTGSITRYLKNEYLKEIIDLSKEDELFETIMMGLRLVEGINIDEINNRYNIDFMDKYKDTLEKYIKIGMLEVNQGYLYTTSQGMKYLNNILVDFM
jgi:oxygen-independent coproporphyrinogen-3 oxidase